MNAILKTLKDKWWQIALAIGLTVLAALGFIFFVKDPKKLSVWEWLQAVGYVITVAMASIAIYVANRRAKAMEETAQAGHDANEQKAYSDAVANLGNENSALARLAGIYGLYDWAQSKPKRRRNITEILCAHLRETTQNKAYQKDNGRQPSNEIQSLLDVLCELNKNNLAHKESGNIRLNLKQSYLRGANLEGKNLRKAQLQGAQLQGAILFRAELQGAKLWGAELQGVSLMLAQLQGAKLSGAQLQGAKLWGAQLQGADLSRAELQGAELSRAQLQGAELSRAQLQGAELSRAQLQGADLGDAQLQGAFLSGAELQGADLSRAELQGATCALDPYWDESFEEWIKSRVGEETSLEDVVFSGGLTDEKITKIHDALAQFDKDRAEKLCAELREHHLGEASHEPPKGAETGVLTEKMADKIVGDYCKGLCP